MKNINIFDIIACVKNNFANLSTFEFPKIKLETRVSEFGDSILLMNTEFKRRHIELKMTKYKISGGLDIESKFFAAFGDSNEQELRTIVTTCCPAGHEGYTKTAIEAILRAVTGRPVRPNSGADEITMDHFFNRGFFANFIDTEFDM